MNKLIKFLSQSTIPSFYPHKHLPLWKAVLYDYFYPILWVIIKIKS